MTPSTRSSPSCCHPYRAEACLGQWDSGRTPLHFSLLTMFCILAADAHLRALRTPLLHCQQHRLRAHTPHCLPLPPPHGRECKRRTRKGRQNNCLAGEEEDRHLYQGMNMVVWMNMGPQTANP